MVIIIFSLSISIGTGIYLPDPDLIHTGVTFPLSLAVSQKIKSLDLYTSLNLIPTGSDDYNLDFYLANLGLLIKTGRFETKLGGGIGKIRRSYNSNDEKGYCYDFGISFGPKLTMNSFSLLPALDFKMISDNKAQTWLIGIGVDIGYEIH